MELVIFIALGAVVAAVAVDVIRRRPARPPEPDPTITSTQKIIVDLSKRH